MHEPYVVRAHFHHDEVDIYLIKAVSTGGPANPLLSYCVLGIFASLALGFTLAEYKLQNRSGITAFNGKIKK